MATSAPGTPYYRDGIPVAFIDWDSAGPVDPLADLAAAAWTFVPLAPPRQLAEAGFDPLPGLPARLRTFVDAYGLADRKVILPGCSGAGRTSANSCAGSKTPLQISLARCDLHQTRA
jgi:hypothetical protein